MGGKHNPIREHLNLERFATTVVNVPECQSIQQTMKNQIMLAACTVYTVVRYKIASVWSLDTLVDSNYKAKHK